MTQLFGQHRSPHVDRLAVKACPPLVLMEMNPEIAPPTPMRCVGKRGVRRYHDYFAWPDDSVLLRAPHESFSMSGVDEQMVSGVFSAQAVAGIQVADSRFRDTVTMQCFRDTRTPRKEMFAAPRRPAQVFPNVKWRIRFLGHTWPHAAAQLQQTHDSFTNNTDSMTHCATGEDAAIMGARKGVWTNFPNNRLQRERSYEKKRFYAD